MIDFRYRSRKEELLDQPNILKEDLFLNLRELDAINRLLGGHQATLVGLKKLISDKSKEYTIVDYACGGGDTLRCIDSFAKKNNLNFRLIGFDLLEDAIIFSKYESEGLDIEFYQSDFRDFKFDGEVDIAINALCCHHFYYSELECLIQKMYDDAKIGVIINDLHRHPFAYYSISFLTKLFSKSHYVKHDAKLSVLRGFRKKEWVDVLEKLRFKDFSVNWIWAFRHLIIVNKSNEYV